MNHPLGLTQTLSISPHSIPTPVPSRCVIRLYFFSPVLLLLQLIIHRLNLSRFRNSIVNHQYLIFNIYLNCSCFRSSLSRYTGFQWQKTPSSLLLIRMRCVQLQCQPSVWMESSFQLPECTWTRQHYSTTSKYCNQQELMEYTPGVCSYRKER